MTDFATQSGHWYKLDGSPCYTIEAAKGGIMFRNLLDYWQAANNFALEQAA